MVRMSYAYSVIIFRGYPFSSVAIYRKLCTCISYENGKLFISLNGSELELVILGELCSPTEVCSLFFSFLFHFFFTFPPKLLVELFDFSWREYFAWGKNVHSAHNHFPRLDAIVNSKECANSDNTSCSSFSPLINCDERQKWERERGQMKRER